ncbi:MAG TPA: hypothetical protein VG317_22545 [Pseudonocardiaceae bacterium]|nr:hypothetical protein [Pseudonocardiaceae bacterium]
MLSASTTLAVVLIVAISVGVFGVRRLVLLVITAMIALAVIGLVNVLLI